jgi:hypothetical protein
MVAGAHSRHVSEAFGCIVLATCVTCNPFTLHYVTLRYNITSGPPCTLQQRSSFSSLEKNDLRLHAPKLLLAISVKRLAA